MKLLYCMITLNNLLEILFYICTYLVNLSYKEYYIELVRYKQVFAYLLCLLKLFKLIFRKPYQNVKSMMLDR